MKDVNFLRQIIRAYRKTYNLTQAQAAGDLGISRNWLSRIERGEAGDVSFSLGMKILDLPSHAFHRQIEISLPRRICVDAQIAAEIQWLNLVGAYTEASCQGPPPTALIKPAYRIRAEQLGYKPEYQEDTGLWLVCLKGGLRWVPVDDQKGRVT